MVGRKLTLKAQALSCPPHTGAAATDSRLCSNEPAFSSDFHWHDVFTLGGFPSRHVKSEPLRLMSHWAGLYLRSQNCKITRTGRLCSRGKQAFTWPAPGRHRLSRNGWLAGTRKGDMMARRNTTELTNLVLMIFRRCQRPIEGNLLYPCSRGLASASERFSTNSLTRFGDPMSAFIKTRNVGLLRRFVTISRLPGKARWRGRRSSTVEKSLRRRPLPRKKEGTKRKSYDDSSCMRRLMVRLLTAVERRGNLLTCPLG